MKNKKSFYLKTSKTILKNSRKKDRTICGIKQKTYNAIRSYNKISNTVSLEKMKFRKNEIYIDMMHPKNNTCFSILLECFHYHKLPKDIKQKITNCKPKN